ncbi:tetratricopeptide repeat protein [Breznakiellaceae bacterium SP9]
MRTFFVFGLLFLTWGVFAQTRTDAVAEYRSGNYERAISICKQDLAVNPRNIDSHVVLCWSLIRLSRYREAQGYANAGRAISRFDPRIIEVLGEISYYEGRNIEALQYFQEYINTSPEGQRIDVVYYFIGEIYILLGRFKRADIALSTAIYYSPGNAAWWTRLAYARECGGELQQAIAAYAEALRLNSQASDARRGIERARQSLLRR